MLNPLKPAFKSFYSSAIKSTNEKIKKHPILFASFFACIKNSVADYTIQKTQDSHKNKDFNIKRTIAFSLFGLIHVGAGQYIILNKIIPRIIPSLNKKPTPPLNALLKAVTLDQFVHVPLIYFPLFYTFKELGESTISNPPSRLTIMKNYKENFKNDMLISASIFMPIQLLNYKYIPTHLRVPLLSSCGFLYVMLLSYLRL